MADRSSNQKFVIRGSNTTLSLPECYKRNAQQGSVSYYPTQEVFEASQNWKCLCYEVTGTNDRTLNRIPLVVNGGKFIDINVMEIGDYYYYHDSDKQTVIVRVNNEILYAVNSTDVIDDGTSFTWQEIYTAEQLASVIDLTSPITFLGDLEIKLTAYNGNTEVPIGYNHDRPMFEMDYNGNRVYYDDFIDVERSTHEFKVGMSNNRIYFSELGTTRYTVNSTNPFTAKISVSDFNTDRINKLVVDYKWTYIEED